MSYDVKIFLSYLYCVVYGINYGFWYISRLWRSDWIDPMNMLQGRNAFSLILHFYDFSSPRSKHQPGNDHWRIKRENKLSHTSCNFSKYSFQGAKTMHRIGAFCILWTCFFLIQLQMMRGGWGIAHHMADSNVWQSCCKWKSGWGWWVVLWLLSAMKFTTSTCGREQVKVGILQVKVGMRSRLSLALEILSSPPLYPTALH